MKVYICSTHYDYEGSEVTAVYSTEEAAKAHVEVEYDVRRMNEEMFNLTVIQHSSHFEYEEWEVEE